MHAASVNNFQMISVVIPVRNERETITTLLSQLANSAYPNFEVIVVDDGSSDGTSEIVKTWARELPKFQCISSQGEGKKKAITTGVMFSKGTLVATTDGDCQIDDDWLYQINACFHSDQVVFAFGAVAIQSDGKLFADMQAIEFSSLIGSGASFSALGYPVMCNGANRAYRKAAFEEVDGYVGNFHVPSGDDEFLMRKMQDAFPGHVVFMPSGNAVVRTQPKATLKEFFFQRLRWAGKWKYNDSRIARIIAMVVWAGQMTFIGLISLLFLPTTPFLKTAAIVLLVLRFTIEYFFLSSVCRFLKVKWRWTAYLLLQLFYPFYIVVTGLFSTFLPVTWKNRRIL
jgi:poly-beta-1,6-N-acetyl-D-glucosamine synthase